MPKPSADYRRDFYTALEPSEPLQPDDPRRVTIYGQPGFPDPIADLRESIEWTPLDSVHLFSGFRGTGKSTELLRLADELRGGGALVVMADMREYLNLEDIVDIGHLLMSVAGAFSDALASPELLGKDVQREGWWTRARNFLVRTTVEFPELEATTKALGDAGIKAGLKTDPSLREQLREHLAGSMSAFVKDVRTFMAECVRELRAQHGQDARIVLILDSIEQISVQTQNHEDVTESLVRIFSTHASDLRFDDIHLVYTIPPWLEIANKGLADLYQGTFTLPCVKVRERDGSVCERGIGLLVEVVERREADWRRLFEDETALRRLVLASGGYIRDLFRLLRLCITRARPEPPISNEAVALVRAQVADKYLPISHHDARWLARVAGSHEAELRHRASIPDLAGYFDEHLVLCYQNGSKWYDVHPLVAEHVRELIERIGPDEGAA